MSLEHAQEVYYRVRNERYARFSTGARLLGNVCELLVDLTEEVRWLRNDLHNWKLELQQQQK